AQVRGGHKAHADMIAPDAKLHFMEGIPDTAWYWGTDDDGRSCYHVHILPILLDGQGLKAAYPGFCSSLGGLSGEGNVATADLVRLAPRAAQKILDAWLGVHPPGGLQAVVDPLFKCLQRVRGGFYGLCGRLGDRGCLRTLIPGPPLAALAAEDALHILEPLLDAVGQLFPRMVRLPPLQDGVIAAALEPLRVLAEDSAEVAGDGLRAGLGLLVGFCP